MHRNYQETTLLFHFEEQEIVRIETPGKKVAEEQSAELALS